MPRLRLRLFNGHRPVFLKEPTKKSLIPKGSEAQFVNIRGHNVSPDVAKFYHDLKRHDEALFAKREKSLLFDPASFLSIPKHVPLDLRKQVYLPDFTITLIRTPKLPPKFASFWVPLSFSKLDLRDFLDRVYGVKVLHVRSYVVQGKVTRSDVLSYGAFPSSPGPIKRQPNKKKMTVELVEPFVWPEEVKDFANWEKKEFFASEKDMEERQDKLRVGANQRMTKGYSSSIAEQAKALLEGKEKWRSTRQTFPVDQWAMQGRDSRPNVRP